jgi:flagellar biosynthesis/type III secretory pathway chaperone
MEPFNMVSSAAGFHEDASETKKLLESCEATADALIRVLQEESYALKSFQSDTLLGILPEKELLIRSLSDMMEKLQRVRRGEGGSKTMEKQSILRQKLKEIQRLNHVNRGFIEGALGYWQEFLGVLTAGTVYSQHQGSPLDKMQFKGLKLSREI